MPPNRGGDDLGTPQLAMPKLTPVVKWLLIILGSLFLLFLVEERGWLGPLKIAKYLVLFPDLVIGDRRSGEWVWHLQLWRLLTYPFVNVVVGGDVTSILWSGLSLYFFGPDLEEALGKRRFVAFLLLCTVLTGLIATLFALFDPVRFTMPVLGVSITALSLTAAWGTRFPNRRLLFPPIAGKWLVVAILVLELVMILARGSQTPAASISAIAFGYLLMRYWDRIDDLLDRLRIRRAKQKRDRGLRAIRGGLDDRSVGKPQKPVDKRFLN